MQRVETNAHFCGASLVDSDWALTAFHCVESWMDQPETVQVRFGSADRTSGGVVARAAEVVVPEGANVIGTDIALVRLATPVDLPMAPLPDYRPMAGETVRLIGWGITCPQSAPTFWYCGQSPVQLQGVDAGVQPDWQCMSPLTGIQSGRELCLGGYFTGKSACYGDSGGPAIHNGRVVGVTSRGAHTFLYGNCQLAPAIYTDVSVHRHWIHAVTGV